MEEDGIYAKGLKYDHLVGLLVEAIKELKAENEALEAKVAKIDEKVAKIDELKLEIVTLQAEIAEIKAMLGTKVENK